ncbi:MAG: hypothetical protein RL630_2224 [Verrucomicrobiota bacterium]
MFKNPECLAGEKKRSGDEDRFRKIQRCAKGGIEREVNLRRTVSQGCQRGRRFRTRIINRDKKKSFGKRFEPREDFGVVFIRESAEDYRGTSIGENLAPSLDESVSGMGIVRSIHNESFANSLKTGGPFGAKEAFSNDCIRNVEAAGAKGFHRQGGIPLLMSPCQSERV